MVHCRWALDIIAQYGRERFKNTVRATRLVNCCHFLRLYFVYQEMSPFNPANAKRFEITSVKILPEKCIE